MDKFSFFYPTDEIDRKERRTMMKKLMSLLIDYFASGAPELSFA